MSKKNFPGVPPGRPTTAQGNSLVGLRGIRQLQHQTMKTAIRKCFYRSSWIRSIVGFASVATGRTKKLRLSHLQSYDDEGAIGPLQQDEAAALFGLIRALRPKTIVEFGFFHGHSAFNFLMAMEDDALLASYDVDDESLRRARDEFAGIARLRFFHKSQDQFDPADVDAQPLDFVFFDAAHELELNQRTFSQILPHLAPAAVIGIHDTGTWPPNRLQNVHRDFIEEGRCENTAAGAIVHQPGERAFVEWVLKEHPGFQAIHLHSHRTLRHGMTLLQAGPAWPDCPG